MSRVWRALCDRCGFDYYNYELRKEWTGFMVCDKCWEPRHPQDMIRAPKESEPLPWTRPDNDGVDVGVALNPATQTEIPAGTFTTNNETL